jgi:two-component system cell cycle sensor histidine kinase/response regulator CckA
VDLVILDMIMDPGMDGLETWRRIVHDTPGSAGHHRQRLCGNGQGEKPPKGLGAGEYLRKPYMIDQSGKSREKRALHSDPRN